MKRTMTTVILILVISMNLFPSVGDIMDRINTNDCILLFNVDIYSEVQRTRKYLNSMQTIEYRRMAPTSTDILVFSNAPKDSVGIAWLYQDSSRLYFDPVYREFQSEQPFPAYLIPVFPPSYSGFKTTEYTDDRLVLESDSYRIEYTISTDGFIAEKTVTALQNNEVVLISHYSGYILLSNGSFFPSRETRWSMLLPRVELEYGLVDVKLMELKDRYFTKEYILEVVK